MSQNTGSRSLPPIHTNFTTDFGTSSSQFQSSQDLVKQTNSPGKKKKGVHRLTAKLQSLPRSYVIKRSKANSPSDSTSSEDEKATPGPLVFANNASMPDLSKEPQEYSQNISGRLRKSQQRSITNEDFNGYLSEDNVYSFKSPISMVNRLRSQSRAFSYSPIPLSASKVFRRKLKPKNKHSPNSAALGNILNHENIVFSSPSPRIPASSSITEQSTGNSQPGIVTLPIDRLSDHVNFKRAAKYQTIQKIFLFHNRLEQNNHGRYILLQVSEYGLYYGLIHDSQDLTWCIEHFETFGAHDTNNINVEKNQDNENFEKDSLFKYSDVGVAGSIQVVDKPEIDLARVMNRESPDLLISKFQNLKFEKLAAIDEVSITDFNNNSEPELFQISINRKREVLLLKAISLQEKREFLNRIQFFAKEKPQRENLRFRSEKIPAKGNLSEKAQEPSSDEYGFHLVEELGNECYQHEEKVHELCEVIKKQKQQLDFYIRKFQELDGRSKDLNESIFHKRARSTRDMEETIKLTTCTTTELIERLTFIKTRIRGKRDVLKQHQQLLMILQKQIEMQKHSVKMVSKYQMLLAVIVTCAETSR
ncbi:hypothetical protein G9A89_008816 [Geosiphon pyriformis]|nr:hypothetical protein G9A89_008816 [Geosiphon pyriformis]